MRESRDKSLLALVVVFLLVTVGVRFEIFTPKLAPTVLFPLQAERSGGEIFERLEKAGYRVEMSGEWVMIDLGSVWRRWAFSCLRVFPMRS